MELCFCHSGHGKNIFLFDLCLNKVACAGETRSMHVSEKHENMNECEFSEFLKNCLLLTLNFRSSDVCSMDTSSWSACACPSSGPRQTSLSRQDQWFWPCSIRSYQVCHLLLQACFICTRQQSRWMGNGVFNRVKTSPRLFRQPWSSLADLLHACVAGIMLLLLCFFAFLHCWLNLFAELLRFADRMFYKVCGLAGCVSLYHRP